MWRLTIPLLICKESAHVHTYRQSGEKSEFFVDQRGLSAIESISRFDKVSIIQCLMRSKTRCCFLLPIVDHCCLLMIRWFGIHSSLSSKIKKIKKSRITRHNAPFGRWEMKRTQLWRDRGDDVTVRIFFLRPFFLPLLLSVERRVISHLALSCRMSVSFQ